MGRNARLLAPALGVLSLVAAVLLCSRGSGAPPHDTAASGRPPAIRWQCGAHQAYRVTTEAVMRARLPGAEKAVSMEARVSGVLDLEVLESKEGGARGRFRLAPASYATPGGPDRAGEIRLSTPFDVAFDADGRPVRFDFPAALPAEGKVVLEQLIRTFQVVTAGGSTNLWISREENGMGRYVADYRAAKDGTLIKEKTAFEEVTAGTGFPGPLEVRLPRSRAVVRLSPDASWVEAVTLEEEMQVLARGEPVMESTLKASLTRLSVVPPAPKEVPAPSPGGPDATVRIADPAAELNRLLEGLEGSGGTSTACVHGIRDLVSAYPETAALVPAALADGSVGDHPAAALINALELSGTPRAQAALGSILEGPSFGRMNRLRAAIALGGVADPTSDALDSLWRTSALRQPGEAAELADTALLSLGALAVATRGEDSGSIGPVETRLVGRLAATGDPDEEGILLGALGNARNPALLATVAPYLDNASAYVRGSAADALGGMPGPATEVLLSARLRQESDPRVRTALASALNRMPNPSLASLEIVQALVLKEESNSARLEMAKLLGENLDTLPGARQTLRKMLRGEKSARVRSYVGRVLLRQ